MTDEDAVIRSALTPNEPFRNQDGEPSDAYISPEGKFSQSQHDPRPQGVGSYP